MGSPWPGSSSGCVKSGSDPGRAARLDAAPPGAVRLAVLPPLSLYVHLPWCVRKCPYCDFNSHEPVGDLPEQAYVDALIADLEGLLPAVWGRRVSTIFIGGGTPSLFSARAIDTLLSAVRARIPVEPEAEVTLEANPGTVEAARFRGYRNAGVNRVSLGIQSFDAAMLRALGRIHDPDDARRAIEVALKAFDNVNLDLMYALPGQSLAMARADLEEAARLGTAHLSAYQLAIEPNTAFHRRPPALPDHDAAADMQRLAEETLAAAGFGHYETSAFARPGRACRHNLNYWTFGDYLGIGAGAHGKISFPDRVTRHARVKHPRDYLAAAPAGRSLAEDRAVPASELPFEFMMNALRLVDGFPVALFSERTGQPIIRVERALGAAEAKGLIERDWQRIRPSARGRHFLNDLLGEFLGA